MLLAIISDSHDNEPNVRTALDYCTAHGITTLLHCGDVANADTLKLIATSFPGQVHVIAGNADYDEDAFSQLARTHRHLKFYGAVGQLTTPDGTLGWCHHPGPAKALAQTGRYRAVFYGHTHRPWEELVNQCRLINPGTLAGLRYRATFATYDTATHTPQLILLDQLHTQAAFGQ